MNNFTKYLIATLILSVSSTLMAAGKDFFAGISIGQSILDSETGNSGLSLDSDGDTAFKIYGGYDFTNNISIEGFWADAGQATFQPSGYIDYKIMGVTGVYSFPGNDSQFRGFVKAGAGSFSHSTDLSINRDNDISAIAGLGFEYNIADLFALRGEYEYFASDAQMVSIGLSKRFSLFTSVPKRGSTPGVVDKPALDIKETVAAETVVVEPVVAESGIDTGVYPEVAPEIMAISAVPYQGEEMLLGAAMFEQGASSLMPTAHSTLDVVAAYLVSNPETSVTLTGLAGGAVNKQQVLLRARTVALYLHQQGVPKSKIRFTVISGGLGEVEIVTD